MYRNIYICVCCTNGTYETTSSEILPQPATAEPLGEIPELWPRVTDRHGRGRRSAHRRSRWAPGSSRGPCPWKIMVMTICWSKRAQTHTLHVYIYIIHKIRLYLSIDSFATHCARQLWLAYFQLPLAPIFSQRTSTDQVDPPHIIQWSPAAMPGRTWCLGEAHHSACWDNQSPHGLNGPGWIIRSIRFENWFLPPVMARNTSYK